MPNAEHPTPIKAWIVGKPSGESDRAVEAHFLAVLRRQHPSVDWRLLPPDEKV